MKNRETWPQRTLPHKERRRKRRLRKGRVLRVFFLLVIIVCLLRIGQACLQSVMHNIRQERLRESLLSGLAQEEETKRTDTADAEGGPDGPGIVNGAGIPGQTDSAAGAESSAGSDNTGSAGSSMLSRYESLYVSNNDLVGWLSIDGMKIDYPVMQCEDDEYYLHHDFYGEDDRYGCLYVRSRADVNTPGTNFIIYGHNMKDGAMFGDLDQYREESFYKEHPEISFDTLYEERTYEIIAVFLSQVYDEEEDVFKYYDFYEAQTGEEFQAFYDNVKALSLYDTGVTAGFGDTFLTLSTCAYHVDDGRFVVVARRK